MGVQSPIGDQVGVWLITGFLGSGKTTVLNACLRGKEIGKGTALIINEVAGLEIDPMLLEHADDDTVILNNGWICCTVMDVSSPRLLSSEWTLLQYRTRGHRDERTG
jgi:G3E family GTPase